ncbi:hypothetical protein C8Q80DRAFT_864623 [Daedaleopsis nitida]|nr:hypothetical protein C8Q80DRAFT_864623 [Daedaleopsis nitida]
MHRATPSSSSSLSASSSSSHRSKKRLLTRDQLLRSLQILGPVSAPLPAELPPSPPASRESSPALGHKRRHDPEPEQPSSKRQRTSSVSSSRPPLPPTRSVPVASAKHEPTEDGEVKEETRQPTLSVASIVLPTNFPVRRPRRGNNMPAAEWDAIYEKCFANGRTLKYSAYARVAAAHSTTSKEYKALRNPPAPSSGYAQHSLLMARLELVDSLLHFIYGLWCKEYGVRTCYRPSWRTVDDALRETELKWQAESNDEREKAFVGLIHMAHAFIHGRKLRYRMHHVDAENDGKLLRVKLKWQQMKRAKAAAAQGLPPDATPKMLPSPASSSTSSSNSTPLGGHGTEATNDPGSPVAPSRSNAPASKQPVILPPNEVDIPVNSQFLWENKSQSAGLRAALSTIERSQATLSLPILLKHFPRTFTRVTNTTLSWQDEHEPDFQDDECELFWPGQALTGEGLGWVCLMGMSMVREFGREYGYEGVDGVVPKANGDPDLGYMEPRFMRTER